jgi:hypothetical protein
MKDKLNSNKKKYNKWLALINIPIQMGVIIYLFACLGEFIDTKYPNSHSFFSKTLILLGVIIAFYNINRQLKNMD